MPLPALGTPIKASGYMVRYHTAPSGPYAGDAGQGCWGWKRHPVDISGVYVGTRFLGITWWKDHSVFFEDCGERRVATIRVYAVAVNHRTVRYVLPRDVEVI